MLENSGGSRTSYKKKKKKAVGGPEPPLLTRAPPSRNDFQESPPPRCLASLASPGCKMGRLSRVAGSLKALSAVTTGIPRKLEADGRGPAPLGTPERPRGPGARGGRPQPRPSPTPCTPPHPPLPGPGARTSAAAGAEQGGPALPPPQRPAPGVGGWGGERSGGSSGARGPRLREGGSLRCYYTWGRRRTGQRRPRRLEAEARAEEEEVPGTPPPIVPARPAARSGPLRPARALPRARPPAAGPYLASGRLFPPLMLLIPGASWSGARERTHRQKVKLRQAGSGCWLVLSPSFLPTPLPAVSRAVP